MTWLLEDPRPVLAAGAAAELMLLVALVKSGRGVVLSWMVAVAAVVLALLVLEGVVETDAEQVDGRLHTLAELLVADDVPAVLTAMAPAGSAHSAAKAALASVRVTEARITGLEIVVRGPSGARVATARFYAHVRVRPRSGAADVDRAVRRLEVELRQRQGAWQVVDFQDRGLDSSPPDSAAR